MGNWGNKNSRVQFYNELYFNGLILKTDGLKGLQNMWSKEKEDLCSVSFTYRQDLEEKNYVF